MNTRIERLFGWSGMVGGTLVFVGLIVAGFIPPPSPNDNAQSVADWFRDHDTRVKFGMVIFMFATIPMTLFFTGIVLQIRRIEGAHRALTYVAQIMSAVMILEFLYLNFFWQAAAFRADRAPEMIQTLNDMAWLPFVAAVPPLFLILAAFGTAILIDESARPAFPRWLGYFEWWAAIGTSAGAFAVFFKTGPLAWNGLISFWVVIAFFAAWAPLTSIYLVKAAGVLPEEPQATTGIAGNSSLEIEEKITAMREELDRLSAQGG